jgi:hypothetical protein
MRDRDQAWFDRMDEVVMAASDPLQSPSIPFESLDDVTAVHRV